MILDERTRKWLAGLAWAQTAATLTGIGQMIGATPEQAQASIHAAGPIFQEMLKQQEQIAFRDEETTE